MKEFQMKTPENTGAGDGARTRDLRRDRPEIGEQSQARVTIPEAGTGGNSAEFVTAGRFPSPRPSIPSHPEKAPFPDGSGRGLMPLSAEVDSGHVTWLRGADGRLVGLLSFSVQEEGAELLPMMLAAPDLFAACRCALGALTGNMDGDIELGDPLEMLRAALSKATGGQHV